MLEVPDADETNNEAMYDVVIKQFRRLEKEKTPNDRQLALEKSISALTTLYALSFPGKKRAASADFIVNALIYLMIKSKIKHPFANQRFIADF